MSLKQSVRQLLQAQRWKEALPLLRDLVEAEPSAENALELAILADRLDESDTDQLFVQAIEADPERGEAWARTGLRLAQKGRFEEALPIMERSLELAPKQSAFWVNYGNVLRRLGQLDAAIAAFEEATKGEGERNAMAWNCLGEAWQAKDHPEHAIAAFEMSASLDARYVMAHSNMGLVLQEQGKLQQARAAFDQALALEPDDPVLKASLGALMRDCCRIDACLPLLEQAARERPSDYRIVSKFLYSSNFSPSMGMAEVERLHQLVNACFSEQGDGADLPWPRVSSGRALRVGFVSGDLRVHSVAFFLLPLLREIDRSKYSIHCYAEVAKPDGFTQRFRSLSDGWHSTCGQSAAAVAQTIRNDQIDVLIDLSGHTSGSRLDVFALKPAPLQLNWLGYPHATGLRVMDGRIVDAFTDPATSESAEDSESLIRMDGCFLCYEAGEDAPSVGPLPAEKNGFVTFGSFNNAAKINDAVIALWAKVLLAVEGSRLLLKSWQFADESLRRDLGQRFHSHGVAEKRICFLERADSYRDHLQLYDEIDIALDCFPYNGTTTTCEALFMGAPVIALQGDRHAARVGVSLLNAIGKGSWLASDASSYVGIAVSLAGDLTSLAKTRAGLREAVKGSDLGDASAFARRFQGALEQACRDLRPENAVEDLLPLALKHHQQGNLNTALGLYRRILEEEPGRSDALHPLGVACYATGLYREAEAAFSQACKAFPERSELWTHWGASLHKLGRFEEAILAHHQSLKRAPDSALALNNLGNVLIDNAQAVEAVEMFERALNINPNDGQAQMNYALALKEAGRLTTAVDAGRKAIALNPKTAPAHSNLGACLVAVGESEEAISSFLQALELDAEYAVAWSNLIFALQYASSPSLENIAQACQEFGTRMGMRERPSPHRSRLERIGIVSADLREHAVARFLLALLEGKAEDRPFIALYSDTARPDGTTSQLREACDIWRSIHGMTDEAAYRQIRSDEIDCLIDLGGHSGNNRLSLFALRPAFMQTTWLGFPGSTGLPAMDYRISDGAAMTDAEAGQFPEQPLRLPEGFHCIRMPEVESPGPLPSSSGEPFTFGSFNNLSKLSPDTVALWSMALNATAGSRLLLKAYQFRDDQTRQRVVRRFEAEGISSDRILFLDPIIDYAEHLSAYKQVDLALDPYPYHGTTTTCEALYMGVPVLSLEGDRVAARMGKSLMAQVGLDAYSVETPEAFVAKAVALFQDSAELIALRARLRQRFLSSSLGDADRFASQFWSALVEGYDSLKDET